MVSLKLGFLYLIHWCIYVYVEAGNLIICEGKTTTLFCPTESRIKIQHANYGRTASKPECKFTGYMASYNCVLEETASIVKTKCESKQSCILAAINSEFGRDPCPGVTKYLSVAFECKKAVDGRLTQWSVWSPCTKSCGGGSKTRNRNCVPPQNGGSNCTGHLQHSVDCNQQICPVDGYLTQWSLWSPCTKTCGGGSKTRYRNCVPPQNGGFDCAGHLQHSVDCNQQICPDFTTRSDIFDVSTPKSDSSKVSRLAIGATASGVLVIAFVVVVVCIYRRRKTRGLAEAVNGSIYDIPCMTDNTAYDSSLNSDSKLYKETYDELQNVTNVEKNGRHSTTIEVYYTTVFEPSETYQNTGVIETNNDNRTLPQIPKTDDND